MQQETKPHKPISSKLRSTEDCIRTTSGYFANCVDCIPPLQLSPSPKRCIPLSRRARFQRLGPPFYQELREDMRSLAFGSPTEGGRFGGISLPSQQLLLDLSGSVLPFCGVPLHLPCCHSQRPAVAFAVALFSRFQPKSRGSGPKNYAPFASLGHLANSSSPTRIIDIADKSTRRKTRTTAP
jgi:hypothetical protein